MPLPLNDHILELAIGGVFSLQVWMVRALTDVRADTRATRQTLFGETGDNGINGTVKQHEAQLRDHERRILRGESRWDQLEGHS